MPIYEYKCLDCGKQFEKIVLANEKPNCDFCNGSKLEKQFSPAGIRTTKSIRKSEGQEHLARSKIRQDRAVAESDFLKKELSEGH
jgi:putative FmdB family regulatory protein